MRKKLLIYGIIFLGVIFLVGCGTVKKDSDGSDEEVVQSTIDHLVFSEVCYDPEGSDVRFEWLEIYNPLPDSLSLVGWTIKTSKEDKEFAFKEDMVIASKQYFIIARNGTGFLERFQKEADSIYSAMSLGNSNDCLHLIDDTGQVIDFVAWEQEDESWTLEAKNGQSLQRINFLKDSDSQDDWFIQDVPNPGS